MRTFAEKAYGIPPEQVDRTGFMLLFGSLRLILYVTFALTPVSYTELLVAMVLLRTSFLFCRAQIGQAIGAAGPAGLASIAARYLRERDLGVAKHRRRCRALPESQLPIIKRRGWIGDDWPGTEGIPNAAGMMCRGW